MNFQGAVVLKIKHYLLLTAVALGLIGSFLLPNAVAGIMDARRLDNLILVEAQSIEVNADPELSLQKRITLVASSSAEVLVLATGRAMERETAEDRAVQELSRFFKESPFEFTIDEYTVEEAVTGFIINSEDPSESMITWEFRILDRYENEATITIDDETGVILKMIYRKGNGVHGIAGSSNNSPSGLSDEETLNTALQLTEMMTEYYGLPVGLGDYEFRSNFAYYMAYMSGGSLSIPMYGVVRASGFTMNERL